MHGLVDRVNDGVDVAFIRAGGQQEDVGQTESLGYVDSGEVLSLLIGRGASSGDSQIGSMFGGGHESPSGRSVRHLQQRRLYRARRPHTS